MEIIIDLLIVAIIVLSTWIGYKKGLTKSLLKIFNFFIAIIISIILFNPIANIIINNTQVDEFLQESIISKFNYNEEIIEEKENNMPAIFSNYIKTEIDNTVNETKENIIKESARQISISIINVGVVIIIFLITRVILIFIKGIADIITKLPVIKQFDKLGRSNIWSIKSYYNINNYIHTVKLNGSSNRELRSYRSN